MKGYVAQKGSRWYAVIYDGLIPLPVVTLSSGSSGCGRRWR